MASNSIWKGLMVNGLRRNLATMTKPKMKAHTPTVDYGKRYKKDTGKGRDFVPVYIAVGMITLSTLLGLHTMKQELMYSPTVYVKKKRRETIPEVVEPAKVAEDNDKLMRKSYFRKMAHIQKTDDHPSVIKGPQHGDAFAHPPKLETLKDVGIDPPPHH